MYFPPVSSIQTLTCQILQAHSDQKLAKMMFLPLAEKMVMKYVSEEKIEAEAEVQLYLIILEQIGKYEEALDVLNGPLGGELYFENVFLGSRSVLFTIRYKLQTPAPQKFQAVKIVVFGFCPNPPSLLNCIRNELHRCNSCC